MSPENMPGSAKRGGNVVVKDLASANGTFLNTMGHQVTSEVLKPGDIVIIGKGKMATFVYKKQD